MSTTKKQQHYVWRHYLKAWAQNEKNIWAYFKSEQKIINPNLMGVAQERYFYELIDFTDKEEVFLEDFIKSISHDSVVDLNINFLQIFTSTNKLKKKIINNGIGGSNKEIIEREIRVLEINLMEDAHAKIEQLGTMLVDCVNSRNYKFLENDDAFYETIMFLCFQYVRTKKMKRAIESSFAGNKSFNMFKFWNITSYAFATTFARSLSFNPDIRFLFYENNTNVNFLTCDQPIINILSDLIDENGNTKGFEWYYPLSPKLALLVHLRTTQKTNIESLLINEPLVIYLNQKVIEYSEDFIFSDNKEQLELINPTK